MGINDFIQKSKIKLELGKYKLSNEQIDDVFNIYNYVIEIFLDKYSEELKTNKEFNRNKVDSKLLDDIGKMVSLSKNFLINDLTMDYIINIKNSQTILQFLNNFHYITQTNSENDNYFYYLASFIDYLMNKAYEDNEFLNKVNNDNSLSKITNDYLNVINEFKSVSDTEKAIEIFNYIVSIIWYNEYIKDYPDIVVDLGLYVINHFDEIIEQINIGSAYSDTSFDDNCSAIVMNYISKKVKKLG